MTLQARQVINRPGLGRPARRLKRRALAMAGRKAFAAFLGEHPGFSAMPLPSYAGAARVFLLTRPVAVAG